MAARFAWLLPLQKIEIKAVATFKMSSCYIQKHRDCNFKKEGKKMIDLSNG